MYEEKIYQKFVSAKIFNLGRNISNLYCKYSQMSSHSRAQRQHKINKKSTFEKSGNLKIEFDILMSVLGVVSQKQYE